MSTADVRAVLAAMQGASDPASGLPAEAVAALAGCPPTQVRGTLKHMLLLEPAWIDGEVVPDRGLVWWLTASGREAADAGCAPAPLAAVRAAG